MVINLRNFALLLLITIIGSSHCDFVNLMPIEPPTQVPNETLISTDWCACNFLAVGVAVLTNGLINVYQFDQTAQTFSLTTSAAINFEPFSIAWCPTCSFLAAAGNSSSNMLLKVFSFDTAHPGNLSSLGTATILNSGGFFAAVDWCSCNTLAAAAIAIDNTSAMQAYYVDSITGISTIGNPVINELIASLKWCNNCQYLAAGGVGFLGVYTLDPVAGLLLTTSIASSNTYYSVDWCDSCNYIAAGGQPGIVDIYRFDTTPTPSLTFVTSATLIPSPSEVDALEWCQGCDNLAVGAIINLASNPTSCVQLYHFDTETGTLSSPTTYTLNFSFSSETAGGSRPTKVIDWCNTCSYLAAVGFVEDSSTTGIIQLFKTIPIGPSPLPAPTNLIAQKICHRFPTQVDIINQLCWNAVTGAVAYNVYADVTLTILLATIQSSPLCYSQHQICAGKLSTYYVTAVDANGNHGTPAAVTI